MIRNPVLSALGYDDAAIPSGLKVRIFYGKNVWDGTTHDARRCYSEGYYPARGQGYGASNPCLTGMAGLYRSIYGGQTPKREVLAAFSRDMLAHATVTAWHPVSRQPVTLPRSLMLESAR